MLKHVIFGAGVFGLQALERLGHDQVAYFLDNSSSKQGTRVSGIPVISVEAFVPLKDSYHVVIASQYAQSMANQLEGLGISDYSIFFQGLHRYYETDELLYNPYVTASEAASEEEWRQSDKLKYSRQSVNDMAADLYAHPQLFNHVEVETINRCNGSCSFCPVNCKIDPRKEKIMSRELFESIVKQLEDMQYSGRFTTFSNNEPLLDERIVEFNQYARRHLSLAKMHLFTNGTLLTLEKFLSLVEVLDELIIDNYQQDLKLIKPCREIQAYCEAHPELAQKVTIVLRKPNEILTTRGGNAPNRNIVGDYAKDRCVLPFKQMIIRPDGKISLCCNDALGTYTLGDLTKESLLDIWYGPRFQMVRKCLYEGRANWGKCQYCDTFLVG